MESKNLRIGNFVSHYNEIITVDGIDDIDVFNAEIGEIPLHSVLPIGITEDWLLKFGFRKDEETNSRWFMEDWLAYDLDDNCIRISDSWEFGKRKYVHELQNLFFAITGNELDHEI